MQYYNNNEDATASVQAAMANWVQKDPKSALLFVQSLPAGDSQNVAVNNLALQWAANDPVAASTWPCLDDPQQREAALVNVVDSWSQWEPKKAATAIDKIHSTWTPRQLQSPPSSTTGWPAMPWPLRNGSTTDQQAKCGCRHHLVQQQSFLQ